MVLFILVCFCVYLHYCLLLALCLFIACFLALDFAFLLTPFGIFVFCCCWVGMMLLERSSTPELEYALDRLVDSRVDLCFAHWVGTRPTLRLVSLWGTFVV